MSVVLKERRNTRHACISKGESTGNEIVNVEENGTLCALIVLIGQYNH